MTTQPSDEHLLALLLGGAHAQARARELLLSAGGLIGLEAASSRLPQRTRARLAAALELGRRVAGAWPSAAWRIRTPADLALRLVPAMGHLQREELAVVLLNTKNAVIGRETVYRGNLAGCPVRVAEVYAEAVRRDAAAVVVVHNHPSGDPTPSAEDLRVTADLAAAGRLLDVELLDHLVIGRGSWASLRALGAL